jgi:hypothetical protein
MAFTKAVRSKTKLRMALDGPSGSGKTFTGLRFAFALAPNAKVAVICSENGSAQKYQGEAPDGTPWEFDIEVLKNYAPTSYTAAIKAAAASGYDVLLIDSLSHEWAGSGGALQLVDKVKGNNSYVKWKDITPIHDEMIEAILTSPIHVIATMRSKTEYVMEPDANGKMVPKKVGMGAVQRPGMEYEFDIYASLDLSHMLRVTKSRCRVIDGAVCVAPDAGFMKPITDWLNSGVPSVAPQSVKLQIVEKMNNAADAKELAEAFQFAQKFRGEISETGWKDVLGVQRARREQLAGGTATIVTAEVAPAVTNGVHHEPPAEPVTVGAPGPVKATAAQLEEMGQLRPHFYVNKRLEADDAKKSAWAELLKPFGVTSARELTAEQADEFLTSLRKESPF